PAATATAPAAATAAAPLLPTDRWRAIEIAFWLIPVVAFFLFPTHRVLGSQILITGLFALSLDLILGYAGIVSLGHAAFFGLGAYVAGLLAIRVVADPLVGLAGAVSAAASLGFVTSFLVLRGADLTKLMVTLGVALLLGEIANRASWLTGGADGLQGITMGPLFGALALHIF